MKIIIAKDFSETLGARYISEGEFSGEEFRNDLLEPKYKEAVKNKEKLTIDLDGTYGYPTSFLEEAFGGLARIYGEKAVFNVLKFISKDEETLINEIISYIENANERK